MKRCVKLLILFCLNLLSPLFSQVQVNNFTLVNSSTNNDIKTLSNSEVIDLSVIGDQINIRANTVPQQTGSVVFTINGTTYRTENVYPYALGGDLPPGNYATYAAPEGEITLCAIPYSGKNASGIKGNELCISLTFVKNALSPKLNIPDHPDINFWGERIALQISASDPMNKPISFSATGLPPSLGIDKNTGLISGTLDLANPFGSSTGFDCEITATNSSGASATGNLYFFILHPSVESFTLIDAVSDTPVQGYDPIPYGATIDLSETGTQLNIRANTSINSINGGGVLFDLNGNFERAENIAPYALGGDQPAGDYRSISLNPGNYELAARIVSGYNGTGGFSFYRNTTLPFTVTEEGNPSLSGKVYPNPVIDYIEISGFKNLRSIRVFDTTMRTELTAKVEFPSERIDISTLPSGLHLLQLNFDEQVKIIKLIKN